MKHKHLLLAILLAFAIPSFIGCASFNGDADPVKVEQTKAVIVPLVSGAVRRILLKNPDKADFVKRVGDVFRYVRDTQTFDPATVAALLQTALNDSVDPGDEDAQLLIDAKNVLLAIYHIHYADRFKADVSEQEFLLAIADVFATAVDQALADTGL